jgi:hypothetical protein
MKQDEYVKTIVVYGKMVNVGMDDYGQQYFIEFVNENGELIEVGCGAYNFDIEDVAKSIIDYERHSREIWGDEEWEEMQKAKDEVDNIVNIQDEMLNTGWYVYGTKKELKESKILVDGNVLKDGGFDADYFTKIDIRNTIVIPLNSKSVKILTTHPEDSYTLIKGSNGEYTLRIKDPSIFWSVSKYLVVRVK